jgi:hypothetical protein
MMTDPLAACSERSVAPVGRHNREVAITRRPVPSQSRLRRALGGAFAWVVIPAVAVLMLVAVLPESSVTLQVLLGRGEVGIFTAEQQLCTHNRNGTHCEWRGRFDGNDGITRPDVYLEGDPPGWQPGTTAKVIWLHDRPASVFHPGDPRPMLLVLGLSVTAAAALLTWAIAALCRVSGRPTPGWIDRVHGFCGWPPTT